MNLSLKQHIETSNHRNWVEQLPIFFYEFHNAVF